MKFKVGDKVRVRKDLEDGKEYGTQDYYNVMGLKGEEVTIKEVYSDYYEIEEDKEYYSWTDEMLEEVKNTKYITIKEKTLKKYQEEAKKNLESYVELVIENENLKGQIEAYEKMLKIKEEK